MAEGDDHAKVLLRRHETDWAGFVGLPRMGVRLPPPARRLCRDHRCRPEHFRALLWLPDWEIKRLLRRPHSLGIPGEAS
jgi:hypothetical protein